MAHQLILHYSEDMGIVRSECTCGWSEGEYLQVIDQFRTVREAKAPWIQHVRDSTSPK